MKVLLTGAGGFLGYHTRVRLRALYPDHEVVLASRDNWSELKELARDCDAIIHIAGVNRGTPHEVEGGNVQLAEDVAAALPGSNVQRVVFANSIWAGTGTPYGAGKAQANTLLAEATMTSGATYVDVRLPNIFGEGGRPNYNSFVATFVDKLVRGEEPEIQDREINLLHVQAAAESLIKALTTTLPFLEPQGSPTSIQKVWDTLVDMKKLYDTGDIPPLLNELEVELFNTLRFRMFPEHYPIQLVKHSDARGDLVETVRAHGGQGQTFVSTTHPCITRGEHFHIEKVERFVVIRGKGRISLRQVFTDKVVSFEVDGDSPVVVDMPTFWLHNITNIGDSELVTLFWAHELFNPDAPDTYWEAVDPAQATEQGWSIS